MEGTKRQGGYHERNNQACNKSRTGAAPVTIHHTKVGLPLLSHTGAVQCAMREGGGPTKTTPQEVTAT